MDSSWNSTTEGRDLKEESNPVGYGSIYDEFYGIAPFLLGHALETTTKLLNMVLSKMVPQMPYEIWHGKPASYKYLGVWGNPAYVKRLVKDKLDSMSNLCKFVGYPEETAGYYFYDLFDQKVFVSMNAVFLKKDFPVDSQCDEVLLEETSETPHQNEGTSFKMIVPTDGALVVVGRQGNRDRLIGMDSWD
ncbi:UNVERIFIED_CONTAM: hypothetical protein Sindi_1681900 [Sesamum indicum]